MERKEGREGRKVGRKGGRETKEGKRQHSNLRAIIKRRKKKEAQLITKNRKKKGKYSKDTAPAHTLSLTSL